VFEVLEVSVERTDSTSAAAQSSQAPKASARINVLFTFPPSRQRLAVRSVNQYKTSSHPAKTGGLESVLQSIGMILSTMAWMVKAIRRIPFTYCTLGCSLSRLRSGKKIRRSNLPVSISML